MNNDNPTILSFVTTQLTPAWEIFGEDLVINFKPFGKANVYSQLMDKIMYIYGKANVHNEPSLTVFCFEFQTLAVDGKR